MQQYLDTQEDFDWLNDVHGIDVDGIVAAILYGNDDWPEKIETYTINDYRATPVVWTPDEEGNFHHD